MTAGRRWVEEWVDAFAAAQPTYEAFTEKLAALVEERLDAEDVHYEWTYTWLMGREDFEERIFRALRNGEGFDDPARDLPNVAGVTVVVDETAEIEPVASLVEREFEVAHDMSISAAEAATRRATIADAPPLGYEGTRYAVEIGDTRSELPEWRPYASLRIQIEIQTILQYAWERLDWNLPYYDGNSYPPAARRALGAFEAIVADADRLHDEIWDALEEEHARCARLVESDELDVEVNGESIKAYLERSERVQTLTRIAVDAGLTADPDPYEPSSLTVEPALWLTGRNDIRTMRELDDVLDVADERAHGILRDIAMISSEGGLQPWAMPDSIVEWLVLVLRRADTRTIGLMQYHHAIEDALNVVIGNPTTHEGT